MTDPKTEDVFAAIRHSRSLDGPQDQPSDSETEVLCYNGPDRVFLEVGWEDSDERVIGGVLLEGRHGWSLFMPISEVVKLHHLLAEAIHDHLVD